MSRFLLTLCVWHCILIQGASMVEAQVSDPAAAYDTRALRLESRPGSWLLLRGREGEVVGSINAFRGAVDLPAVLGSSPEAVREARVFAETYRRGGVLLGLGIGIFGVGGGIARIDQLGSAASVSATIAATAGVFLAAYGARYLYQASSALSKAVWWYNRDLTR